MAGLSITINADFKPVADFLRRLETEPQDLTSPMDEIGQYLVQANQRRMYQGVGPDGQAWEPSVRAKNEGGKTLIDSGGLRDSLTQIPGPDSVEVGTNKVYAAIHQFGGTITAKNAPYLMFIVGGQFVKTKSVTIPARPFVGIADEDHNEILNILQDFIIDLGVAN
ncbi:MAG TPA: phage virion morphogenesis protein [Acidiferrobacteraceae bacterium]|nr:phage virion morphogenesis protein [Acidiferrobacteraceae bacterium]